MDNRIFNNLLASKPSRERRWRVWLLVAAAHVLVITAIVVISNWRESDEVIEIYSEPIILEDALREIKPLPPREPKPAEPVPATPAR